MPPTKPKKTMRRGRRFPRSSSKRRLDVNTEAISWNNPSMLQLFTTEKGKILSRRITGMTAKNHRKLVREIERARNLLLLK